VAATKNILTSLHGKRVGLASDGKLVVNGRTVVTQDDAGSQLLVQGTPGTLNATGTLTAALIVTGIVTSSAASAVVATVDTGTAMDTALSATIAIGEAFDWSAINTHATNAFTVTAATDHTLVGSGVVDTDAVGGGSGRFRSKRTAANVWVTYRIG
jgi:hypothetical protein